jgi:branched-chain amino acid aminotransferase
MSDKEFLEPRHATRGRDTTRAASYKAFEDANEESGFGRRAMVRNSLIAALVASVLPGVTRDTVVTLARRLGIPVHEQMMPREMLYLADEIFMTGTAAEITPIRSVDKITVGRGARGPVTEALQKAFFDVIECRVPDEFGWLTFVSGVGAAAAGRSARKSSAG